MISEILKLKVENAQLKIQQVQAMGNELVKQFNQLIEEARTEDNAPSDYVYNFQSQSFVPNEQMINKVVEKVRKK